MMEVVPTGPLETWSDEDLLATRLCDLPIAIEGSELVPRIEQLAAELEGRGLVFRPAFYLGDEWFSPEGVPAIAIPFYLAHPRLKALEEKMMMEVEGGSPEWCQRLLRHECGHAIEHAYGLHKARKRRELFGPRSADYDPDSYRPHPYSKSFVRHLPNWYAQAHPDEDWAETFAVWLDPAIDWRRQYKGWRALAKLEYVEEVISKIGRKPPPVSDGKHEYALSKLRFTLDTFYKRRRRLYATDSPDFYDNDLRRLFAALEGESKVPTRKGAAAFLRRHKRALLISVSRWTGERKVTIELLLKKLIDRTQTLSLVLAREEDVTIVEVTAYLATLVTNYRFTGRFKRSV